MYEIGGEVFFILERDDERVREAFGLALGADVHAGFVVDNRSDLLRQAAEGIDDFLYLRGGEAVLELVEHDMAKDFFGGGCRGERHEDGCSQKDEGEERGATHNETFQKS